MAKNSSDTGWRGSQEGWLGAAYEALLDSGVEAVKIQPLAKKLKLSRTSFYWFFEDREQLLAALIGLWRDKNTGNLVKRCGVDRRGDVECLRLLARRRIVRLPIRIRHQELGAAIPRNSGGRQRGGSSSRRGHDQNVCEVRLHRTHRRRAGADHVPDPDRVHLDADVRGRCDTPPEDS